MDALHYGAWVVRPISSPDEGEVSADGPKTAEKENGGQEKVTSTTTAKNGQVVVEEPPKDTAPEEDREDNGLLLFIDEDEEEEEQPPQAERGSLMEVEDAVLIPNAPKSVKLTLTDYLCALNDDCSLQELQIVFQSVEARRRMLAHLQQHCELRTAHLRPADRNFQLHAHDFSVLNSNQTFACGGYLGITVRQYFYAKHNIRLKHPYMPTMIEFGGAAHVSYFPLECIHVVVKNGGSVGSDGAGGGKKKNKGGQAERSKRPPPNEGGEFCWPPGRVDKVDSGSQQTTHYRCGACRLHR